MIKETTVVVKWCNSNKKRYTDLGYSFTNYGDTFLVDINDIAPNSSVKITAICEYCGSQRELTMQAYTHITQNRKNKYRCKDCFTKQKILSYDILKRDFDNTIYTLITKESEYVNGNTRIQYLCPNHDMQEMKASNFHNGKRCSKCGKEKLRELFAFSPDQAYQKVKECGGELLNKEDYVNSEIKNLQIICPVCKKQLFTTSLKHFIQHGGQACELCRKKESVGERRIRQWLEANNYDFIQEKWFEDCRDINPLPFDFFLPELNTVIEFDGKQHFEETHFFSHPTDSLTSYVQSHDKIKNSYCSDNGIKIIRIPYTKVNNIEQILQKELVA